MTTASLIGTVGTVIVVDAVARAARRVGERSISKSRVRKTVTRPSAKAKEELKKARHRLRISAKRARALRKKGVAVPTLAAAKKTVAATKRRK